MRPSSRLLLLLLALSGVALQAQELHFEKLDRSLIEQRLKTYEKKNPDRRARLQVLFTEAGCADQAEQAVKGQKTGNVTCRLPGGSPRTIIVGAHYDHVFRGMGVVDNWSGAALLASLYQSLKVEARRHTFVFVGFTGEEEGLVGSGYYAKQMSKEQIAETSAMVNLDSLALGPTKIWVAGSDRRLVQGLLRVAQAMKLSATGVDVQNVGTTDSVSFSLRKIPAITVHSVTQETFGILHTGDDDWKSVKLDDYYDTYRLLAAYLAYLDGALDQEEKGAGETPAPTQPQK